MIERHLRIGIRSRHEQAVDDVLRVMKPSA